MKKIITLLVMLILSVISYSYQHKLSEPLDNFGYTMCTSVKPYGQFENGILNVGSENCSGDKDSYFDNDFSDYKYLTVGIRADNIPELRKYLNNNDAVLMFKCGIKRYVQDYRGTYVEVQRKDIVITDYNNFLEKYKRQYDDYGCIPNNSI